MSPQSAEETPSPAPTSSEVRVEFHVLGCGHGDTILLRVPADKWVLVDCNLPKAEGTRDKFFDFVRSRKIGRLEFIFLTHPDWDHFNGMAEVLEYFTSEGRSVGVFCDSGVNPQQVQAIFSRRAGEKAYARLQLLLDSLYEQRKIQFYEITDQHAPISPKGYRDIASLIPIAPSSTSKRQVTRSNLSRLADNPDARCPANPFSVVLVLTGKHNNSELNVLLAADADTDSLDLALNGCARFV